MNLYLTGAISHGDPAQVWWNLGALDEAAEDLTKRGHEIENPADLARREPGLSWCEYMKRGVASLLVAEGHAILPSWTRSQGSVIEVLLSRVLGIRQFNAPDMKPVEISLALILHRAVAVFVYGRTAGGMGGGA